MTDPMDTPFWRWWEAHEDFIAGFIFGAFVGVLFLAAMLVIL